MNNKSASIKDQGVKWCRQSFYCKFLILIIRSMGQQKSPLGTETTVTSSTQTHRPRECAYTQRDTYGKSSFNLIQVNGLDSPLGSHPCTLLSERVGNMTTLPYKNNLIEKSFAHQISYILQRESKKSFGGGVGVEERVCIIPIKQFVHWTRRISIHYAVKKMIKAS